MSWKRLVDFCNNCCGDNFLLFGIGWLIPSCAALFYEGYQVFRLHQQILNDDQWKYWLQLIIVSYFAALILLGAIAARFESKHATSSVSIIALIGCILVCLDAYLLKADIFEQASLDKVGDSYLKNQTSLSLNLTSPPSEEESAKLLTINLINSLGCCKWNKTEEKFSKTAAPLYPLSCCTAKTDKAYACETDDFNVLCQDKISYKLGLIFLLEIHLAIITFIIGLVSAIRACKILHYKEASQSAYS